MKPLLIVANFKSNKVIIEAKSWIEEFVKGFKPIEGKEVIICPPFTLLPMFKKYIDEQNLSIKLGSQDISQFNEGPYTGEVNGKQVKEFGDYVLVGHSERRSLLKESDELVEKKVENALLANLKPIFFIQNVNTPVPKRVEIIVYEPPESISTVSGGIADNPKDVFETISQLRESRDFKYALYGGSVDSQNVSTFTKLSNVSGVVPGRASLDPLEFLKTVENA